MSLIDNINKIVAQRLGEDERRKRIYKLKANALCDVIEPGKIVEHGDFTFCINSAEVTPEYRLKLDVTFKRDSTEVTHQIIITNPPVLPRERTGNEKKDLTTAISEMLEGFV